MVVCVVDSLAVDVVTEYRRHLRTDRVPARSRSLVLERGSRVRAVNEVDRRPLATGTAPVEIHVSEVEAAERAGPAARVPQDQEDRPRILRIEGGVTHLLGLAGDRERELVSQLGFDGVDEVVSEHTAERTHAFV